MYDTPFSFPSVLASPSQNRGRADGFYCCILYVRTRWSLSSLVGNQQLATSIFVTEYYWEHGTEYET